MFNWFRKTPEQLYKIKEQERTIERIKELSITVSVRGGITVHGLSEYGARKLLDQGKEPTWRHRMIMTDKGDLISWEDWLEREGDYE